MKILQISRGKVRVPPNKAGPPETVIFNTSRHLVRMGHEVVILDRKYSKDDLPIDCVEGVQITRLDVTQVRFGKAPGFIRFVLAELNIALFALKLSGYLRRNGQSIDIIHLHLTLIGLILVTLNRKLRSKMVYTCHLGQWTLARSELNTLERIHLFLDPFLMRRVVKVIALNDIAGERFISKSKIKAEDVIVVHNGVDTAFFNPDIEVESTVKKYGLEGKSVVLFVGRLAKLKGIECLIKAVDIIVNELDYKNTLFILVGSPVFHATEKPVGMEELLSVIRQHQLEKHVMLTGSLPSEEVRMLYTAADIFVLPSIVEGDPLVTLEAMASGKPIIATKVGGIPRQVKDGLNGFLINPANERQLAEKIIYLIDNPDEREEMGQNSRRYAEEEFDWSKVAERLLQVYQS
jgi:glycosyltransferase involved in cell wall biosynthesis